MSYQSRDSSKLFILTIPVILALCAFLGSAGADDFAEPKPIAVLKASDDVTTTAKAERHPAFSGQFKVSYKREGEVHSRVFLVPKELVSKLEGGFSGTLEVKSLVLATNGEPKQLIVDEHRGGKRVHEIEFQVGWSKSGTECTVVVQASKGEKWNTADEPRREVELPIQDADCHHYIFNPEARSS